MFKGYDLKSNYFRFQISPEIVFAVGMMAITPGTEKTGACVEMEASRHPAPDEMDAYERLLGDAMRGDPTLFAREDSVEEAWRIVDPVLKADTPVNEYEPGTWGPKEVDQIVAHPAVGRTPRSRTRHRGCEDANRSARRRKCSRPTGRRHDFAGRARRCCSAGAIS